MTEVAASKERVKKGRSLTRINSLPPGNFFMLFSCLLIFLKKILSGIPSECETDWVQLRLDNSSGLIWVQTVCKGYEQTILVGNELIDCYIFRVHL